jgi:hypothetical protein
VRSFFVLPIVFTALPLVACGGATGDAPDGGDAGHASTTDGSATDASTPPDDAAVEGDAGTLLLQAFAGTDGEVAAQIPLLEPGVGQQETCAAPVDAGACRLTSCKNGGIGSPGFGYGNFGPISASVGATSVALTYDGTGYPTVYFPSWVTLGAGGTMTFRGGNALFPFDVTATIPGLGVITSPVPTTDGGAAIIDTSQDLTVTWLPISIGHIKFGLDSGTSSIGGTAVFVACTFDGASGAGVVPRALLSSLKEMSGTNATYAGLSSELDATTVIDGLTIVTQSFWNYPTSGREFDVTLE